MLLFTYLWEHGVLVGDTLGIDMVHLHLYGGFVRRLVATTTNTNISTSSVLKCPEIK